MLESPNENHGKCHQSFRKDEEEKIIWVPLINNLSQPKKNLYKHINKKKKNLIFHRC